MVTTQNVTQVTPETKPRDRGHDSSTALGQVESTTLGQYEGAHFIVAFPTSRKTVGLCCLVMTRVPERRPSCGLQRFLSLGNLLRLADDIIRMEVKG